jgi:hypothetical protein
LSARRVRADAHEARRWAARRMAVTRALCVAACLQGGCGLVMDGDSGQGAERGLLANVVAQQVIYQARDVVRRMAARDHCASLDWGARDGRPGMSLTQQVRVLDADGQALLSLDVQVRWGELGSLWVEERARWRDEEARVTVWTRRGGVWRRGEVEVAGGDAYMKSVLQAFGALSSAASQASAGAAQGASDAARGAACAHDQRLRPWVAATQRRLWLVEAESSGAPSSAPSGQAARRLVLGVERGAPDDAPDDALTPQRWTITLSERYAMDAAPHLPQPQPPRVFSATPSPAEVAAPTPSGWPVIRALLIEALSGAPQPPL